MTKKKKASVKNPKVFEIKISLQDTSPLVWRKILVHDFVELADLHMLIQITMGWGNSHLFAFEINGKSYTEGETADELGDAIDYEGVQLKDVLGDVKKFLYTYDFGDDWVHDIEICQVLEHDPRMRYPICIDGQNACPPENCGGAGGFEELKETLAGKDSEEKDDLLEFVGGHFNPHSFDTNFVNKYFLWS